MANSMDLMTINQVEPIYVTFSVPEAQLPAIKKYMAHGQAAGARAAAGRRDRGRGDGTLTFVDNTVDVTTGTIKLKGTFPNTDHKLWPGQFVRVTLRLTTQTECRGGAQRSGADRAERVVRVRGEAGSRRWNRGTVTTGARVDQDMVVEKVWNWVRRW